MIARRCFFLLEGGVGGNEISAELMERRWAKGKLSLQRNFGRDFMLNVQKNVVFEGTFILLRYAIDKKRDVARYVSTSNR